MKAKPASESDVKVPGHMRIFFDHPLIGTLKEADGPACDLNQRYADLLRQARAVQWTEKGLVAVQQDIGKVLGDEDDDDDDDDHHETYSHPGYSHPIALN